MAKAQSLLAHLLLFILAVLFTARVGVILFELNRLLRIIIFLIIWYMMIIAIFAGFKNRNNAYPILTSLYSLNLLNLILMPSLAMYRPISFILALIFSVLGIFGAALYASREKKVRYIQFPLDLSETAEVLEKQPEENPMKTKITKTFAPSRYMASKTGEKFHSPKCNWAKKINKKNRVWLKNKDEAETKGFKKCGLCVK